MRHDARIYVLNKHLEEFKKKLDGVFPYKENEPHSNGVFLTITCDCPENTFLAGTLLGAVRGY